MKISSRHIAVTLGLALAGVLIAVGATKTESQSSGVRFVQFSEPVRALEVPEDALKHRQQLEEMAKSLQTSVRPGAEPTEAMVRQQVSELEQFVIENPNSPYVPDLHRHLGNWHRSHGAYNRAYEHWTAAYEQTAGLEDEFGRLLAEESLAARSQLMASLGRLEELLPLIRENKERLFSRPSTAQVWRRTLEATAVMRRNSAIAYKCGVYALFNVAKRMTGHSYVDIAAQPSSINGFSLAELHDLSKRHQLGLSPAFKAPGAAIVVPSVVHWKLNHYAAIVSEHDGRYLVEDPTFGRPVWMDAATIDNEASGYFLIPTLASTTGWRWTTAAEPGQIYGKGYPWFLLEPTPPPQCPTNSGGSGPPGTGSGDGCGTNSGMPIWSVIEPNINLRVSDIPMFYDAATGPSFVLHLTWQQRDPFPAYGKVAHLADGWRADLASWIEGYPFKFQGTAENHFVLKSGDGRQLQYSFQSGSLVSDRDFLTGTWAVRTLSGSDVTEVNVYYSNGARERYLPNTTGYNFFLKERYDATMKAMTFTYDDPDGGVDYQRLTKATTADGQEFNFQYGDSNDTSRVTGVTGPNSRSVTFTYTTIGSTVVLSGITDAAGISSTIGYDNSTWWINKIVTPYGTNSFHHYDSGACILHDLDCIGVDRALLINEPGGTRQAYSLYDNNNADQTNEFAGLIPTAFSASQIPQYQPNDPPVQTLDEVRNGRNSHHWNRQQAAALSTTNLTALTAADYRVSRTRHWLAGEVWAGESALVVMGWELPPSADGTTESQPVFYDYPGKPADPDFYYYRGTNSLPAVISRRMPDGSTYYQYIERNPEGMPTRTTERWVVNSTVTYRTNSFTYASGTGNSAIDGLLILKHVGPLGELLVGRALHPTYGDQIKYETNAVGEVVTYDYNSDRNLTSKLTAAGLLSTYTYNGTSKRLEKIVDSISGTAVRTNSYTWLNGYLRTHTDPRGLVRTFDYDFLGRLTKVEYPDSTTDEHFYVLPASTGFNTSGSPLAVLDRVAFKDRLNNYWYFLPNRNRQLEKIIEPPKTTGVAGTESTIAYCGCGSPSSIVKASNTGVAETTSLSFNYLGQPTVVTLPDGTTYTNRYDLIGRLIGRDDAYMKVTNSYDNLNRPVARVNGAGLMAGYGYNRRDWVIASTNANGVWRTNQYDKLGRMVASGAPDGGIELWSYMTGFPEPARYTNQVSDVTTWAYDAALRRTNEIVVGVYTNSFAYNGANDLLELYDGRQTGTTNRTRWCYDTYGRTVTKLYANGVTNLTYAYDALDRLTNRWTQAKGNTKYAYDPVGSLTNVDYAATADLRFGYDAHNRVSTDIRVGVITNTYAYRPGGLLEYEDTPQWASNRVTLAYTSMLRTGLTLQQPTIGNWSQTYAYDHARRLTNIGGTAGTFAHAYIPAAGTTASRLVQGITVPTTGSGTVITNLYHTTGRMLSTQLRNGASIYNSHYYQLNAGSQRTRQTRTDGSYVDYAYDDAEQLATASTFNSDGTQIAAQNYGYAYDAGQNMVRRTNNVTTTSYPNNVLNQVTGPDNYTYDNNGNRVSRSTYYTYVYDDENQLVTAYLEYGSYSGWWRSEFMYDARGRLRRKNEYSNHNGTSYQTSVETRYVYDGMRVIQERSSSNVPQVTYTRGLDLSGSLEGAGGIGGLLARTAHSGANGTTLSHAFYHADGNGNVTYLIKPDQVIGASYTYDPSGRTIASSGTLASANVQRFSSKMWVGNNVDLYYYGYRFYDPVTQRWLNRDLLEEGDGVNLYAFLRNDSINLIDPYGLASDSVSECATRDPELGGFARQYLAEGNKALRDAVNAAKKAKDAIASNNRRAANNALREELGTATGNSAHHNIPWSQRGHDLLKQAAERGWNVNGGSNGTSLPSKLHDGWKNWNQWHESYNELAKSLLDRAVKQGATKNPQAAAEAAQRISDALGRYAQRCTGK